MPDSDNTNRNDDEDDDEEQPEELQTLLITASHKAAEAAQDCEQQHFTKQNDDHTVECHAGTFFRSHKRPNPRRYLFPLVTYSALIKLCMTAFILNACLFSSAAIVVWLIKNNRFSVTSQHYQQVVATTPNDITIDIIVDNVVPIEADAYFCASYNLAGLSMPKNDAVAAEVEQGLYLVEFESINPNGAAHHILLYECEQLGLPSTANNNTTLYAAASARATWSCGSGAHHHHHSPPQDHHHQHNMPEGPACKGKLKRTLFAWAHGAGPLQLPQGTGFRIAPHHFLVVQVHYNDRFQQLAAKNNALTDSSGIRVRIQRLPVQTTRTAGIWLFAASGFLMPNTPVVAFDMACPVPKTVDQAPGTKTELIPFAFRTHTHEHGVRVEAYRVRQKTNWSLIGSRNPQAPQVFVRMNLTNPPLSLESGDMVAARCIMSNNSSRLVRTDAGMNDEMCNFYLMYYNAKGPTLIDQRDSTCFTPGAPFITWAGLGLEVPPTLRVQSSTTAGGLSDIFSTMLTNL